MSAHLAVELPPERVRFGSPVGPATGVAVHVTAPRRNPRLRASRWLDFARARLTVARELGLTMVLATAVGAALFGLLGKDHTSSFAQGRRQI